VEQTIKSMNMGGNRLKKPSFVSTQKPHNPRLGTNFKKTVKKNWHQPGTTILIFPTIDDVFCGVFDGGLSTTRECGVGVRKKG